MRPLVSVLMSVKDGMPFLPEAMDSILGQTLGDLELIVLEDGSKDGSGEMAASYAERDARVRLEKNPGNLGLAASLNRGLRLARGKYIARQDADDVSLPERLARQTAFMEARPQVILSGAAVLLVDEKGRDIADAIGRQPCSDAAIRWKMLITNAFHHSTVMLRPEALAARGLSYNAALPFAQDYDLWSRLLRHGQGANLPEALLRFRQHPGQASQRSWQRQQAVADEVAWANFLEMGLTKEFTQEEVFLLRRVGSGLADLSPSQRRAQLDALRHFLRRAGAVVGGDAEWKMVESGLWYDLRHVARHWPRDAATLRTLWGSVTADPKGAALDAWRLGKAVLGGRRRA